MRKNKSTLIWIAVVVIVLSALFALPRLSGNGSSLSGGGIPCIAQRQPLNAHIHPYLTISVGGEFERIPGSIGNSPCLRQIHTHTADGELHIEPQGSITSYTLEDFFKVWGKTISREGYSLNAILDGEPLDDPGALILEDGQQIVLEYERL